MKQKKMIWILIVLLIIVISILSFFTVRRQKLSKDERRFRNEYEHFNHTKNLSGVSYFNVTIPEDNDVIYASPEKVIKLLEEGTGVIYFGYPQSAFTRYTLESFFEAKEEVDLTEVYYYNAYQDRDEKRLDEDGKITTIKKGTETYNKILELLGEKADQYEGFDDPSMKRLYFPTVVFVKDGKVIDTHVSTVSSHQSERRSLTKKQKEELKKIYIKLMEKVK